MRLPRPRLTVRRLMIVVALAGLVMAGLNLMARRREYALARAKALRIEALKHTRVIRLSAGTPWLTPYVLRYDPTGRFYDGLRMKWQSAAARPWLPFEADPPAPE